MTLRRRIAGLSVAALLLSGLATVMTSTTAEAHGTPQKPGSRTWLCYLDGLDSTGAINPINPACKAAVAISGSNSLYNWFSDLRSDAGGRTTGYIADGNLCSGGNDGKVGSFNFLGYDLTRTDWPLTHLTSGANFNFEYSNWAHHPGTFYFYVTRDGFDPTSALKWSDLEQFLAVTNPPNLGGPGTNDGHYYWTGTLPRKSGRHIIYSRWVRSDSNENFFACSDVVFDGGNGNVTGLKDPTGGGNTTTTTRPTTTTTTTRPTTTTTQPTTTTTTTRPTTTTTTTRPNSTTTTTTTRPTTTTTTTVRPTTTTTTSGGGSGSCSVTTKLVSAWPGGYQVEATVTAGSRAITSWTASLTLASGQAISQIWSGTLTTSGSTATVKNVNYNGALSAGGSATFGYLGSGTAAAPSGTCTGS